jgi:hypothetical protein
VVGDPRINGGAWLQVEGTPVDWLYRELGQVFRAMDECRAGRPAIHYQPGHPHGFHTHIYMGEIHHCRPLHDPDGALRSLKNIAEDYPPLLKRALIQVQLWEARFALDTCRKSAARDDTFYVTGCLFRCAACMVQALFALNERHLINEKGSVEATDSLPLRPADFKETVDSVLAHPGERPEQLESSVRRLENLLKAVGELCLRRTSARAGRKRLRTALKIPGVPLVVFAALAVHASGGFKDVLRVEAAEGAGLQDLIHGVLRDHHPPRRVRHGQRLVERAVDDPHHPSSRTRTG